MTEQIHDQISAFADDELSAEECEFLVRRLVHDTTSQQKALRYAAIGAALRGELLGPDPDILRRRLQEELGGLAPSPHRQAPQRPGVVSQRMRQAAGFGIAATVAVVALLAINGINVSRTGSEVAGTLARAPLTTAAGTQALSYVVPQDVATNSAAGIQPVAVPIRLTNYLVQHGEYASGISRTSIHTNVVGNQGSWVAVDRQSEQAQE